MDWTLEDNMVDGLFFCATLTGRRGGHIPFVQAGAETSDTGAEVVKQDPGCSWEGHFRRMGAGIGDENTESRSFLQPHRIPLVICPERRTYVVVVKWTDELCGGYKRVSRFETPCIQTRWTGERWVEQVSRIHDTACQRQYASFATKLSRLDACQNRKVVRWCRTHACSHNSQDVVDGEVNEADVNTAAPDRRAEQFSYL